MNKIESNQQLYQVVVNKIQEGKDLVKMNLVGAPLIGGAAIYLAYKDHPVIAMSFGAASFLIGGLTYVVHKKVKNLDKVKKDLEEELI